LLPFTKTRQQLQIPQKEMKQFIEYALTRMQPQNIPIEWPASFDFQILDQLVKKTLILREVEGELYFDLQFEYSAEQENAPLLQVDGLPFKPVKIIQGAKKNYVIQRQQKVEEAQINFLLANRLKITEDGLAFTLKYKVNPFDWLFNSLPEIAKHGFEVLGEENLEKLKVKRVAPKIISKVTSDLDWFDLNVELDFDGLRVSYFEISKALKSKKKYIQLTDGSAVRLDEKTLKKLGLISHFAQKVHGKDELRLSKTQALILDEILKSSSSAKSDKAFKQQLKKFKSFEKIEPVALPENFKGQLRPYQKAGLDWLCFLNQFGFGGCLADDMGLGKTIQALALLQREKEKAKTPLLNLVVAPTSVLSNWQLEAQRFTPDLKVLIHYGNERSKEPAHFESYDLVVTSYALLRRDYEIFREMQFHYVILDESQKIKNPHSQSAQVARMLKARHRLVMTGTPIENNLSELWSQFQFLNPGMLGSLKSFTQFYGTAIEKHGDKEKAEQLKRIIFPFILRRTKEQVAKELPPKSENVLYCDMEKQQANLYKKWRDYYRALILKQIDEQGMNRSKMKVLEGLTRLRQISINPAMVEKNYKKDSGKFEALWNILEDVFSEGHKVLLFSQFVKALTLVREKLDNKKLKYAYLDGSTKNRQQIIDQFQTQDDLKIFLISLKAGGLGLNLTAADYVIHLDPWWNPAVESQATDRAYRIGQYKNVFVYKLITKDSVEEKILALQGRKKKLADELISTDSTFFKNLERSDIELLFS
ncbi:MAG TPA: DEAD/DEAH box helicase, partial [Caldithrix abyssi]|nr:DEAD/DEAH box helicase [Caldithrix abyssi]